MGSASNNPSNPWAPYGNYNDCSQGICSIYCPQWCYMIFPPPPPLGLSDDSSGPDFSPLIIAVIGILASAFLLVSYYTIVSKYCRRRGSDHDNRMSAEMDETQMNREAWQVAPTGLDDALIRSIAVCKYKKGELEGLVEGTDCSVCLNEFQEDESLRLLPKCNHAFHLPCIDTWLKSNSSCPLCRSNIIASINPNPLPLALPLPAAAPAHQLPAQGRPNNSTNISSLDQYQRHPPNNISVVVVLHDLETSGVPFQQEPVVSLVSDGVIPKTPIQASLGYGEDSEGRDINAIEIRQERVQSSSV
ncbi:hypothetical protein L1049_019019 [Liquidambar formosana]|uniref:RING-type E3 ubiquitin transferase n=1 Tax=Liquidambar formosana TaxID=63359 RepID=A0AAP0RBX8_LIQFO